MTPKTPLWIRSIAGPSVVAGLFLFATRLDFAVLVVAGIGAGRRHWRPHPAAWIYAPVLAVFLARQGLFLWAKKVNPFFSSVARILAALRLLARTALEDRMLEKGLLWCTEYAAAVPARLIPEIS
jgi:hypothetical protein